jgi:hypothetical protein
MKFGTLGLVCFSGVRAVRMNCCVWFGFGGATVQVACSGQEVSCYTTVGGDVLLKDKLPPWLKTSYSLSITRRGLSVKPKF